MSKSPTSGRGGKRVAASGVRVLASVVESEIFAGPGVNRSQAALM